MNTQRRVKTQWTGRLILTVTAGAAVLGSVVWIGLHGIPQTPAQSNPDANQVLQGPSLLSERQSALRADLAALSACFVPLRDANVTPEVQERTLRQEQLGVAHCLYNTFRQDADTLFILAMAYQEQGQSVQAVDYLIQCLKRQADRADAYDQLGLIAQQKGDHDKAIALFQEAVTHDPNLPGIHFRLAEVLHAQGRLPQALTEARQVTRLNPRSPEGFVLKGQISLQMKDYEQAKAAYEQAIQLNPDLTKPYFALATACARLGLKEESQAYQRRFKEVEAANRQSAKEQRQTFDSLHITAQSVAHTHTDVARIFHARGKPGQAGLLYERARKLDPGNLTCSMELADLLLRSGQSAEALRVYQEIVELWPNQGVAHFFIGHIHEKLGHWDAAQRAYQQVVAVTPKRPEGYQALARFYLTRGSNLPRARELAQQAIALSPMAANYYLLAQICYQLNARDEAVTAVARAIELAPGHVGYLQFHQKIRELK